MPRFEVHRGTSTLKRELQRLEFTLQRVFGPDCNGNVFADLGIPNAEQNLAKAVLAAKILGIVQRRRLTQAAASRLLGISQPKVSALLKGRLDGFSSDRLFRFLNALGCDVNITVSRPHPATPGRVLVTAT